MAASIWMLFRPRSLEAWMKILTALCSAAFLLGGGLQLMENLFFGENFPFFILAGSACGLALLFRNRMKKFWEKKNTNFVRVKLLLSEGCSFSLLALVDSGNSLREPISGSPVSLVEKRVLIKGEENLLPCRFRVVPFHSVGRQKGLMEAYKIEGMEIEQDGEWKRIKEPFIGIVSETISAKKHYQMILHPELLKN